MIGSKEDKKLSLGGKDASPVNRLVGEILIGTKKDGHKFCAKLVAVYGDELYFETSSGVVVMDRLSNLECMSIYDSSRKRQRRRLE